MARVAIKYPIIVYTTLFSFLYLIYADGVYMAAGVAGTPRPDRE